MILLYNPRATEFKYRLPLSVLSLAAVFEGIHPWRIVDGNVPELLRDKRIVVGMALDDGSLAFAGAGICISQAFRLGCLKRAGFDEDALALVALPASRPLHDHGLQH